MRAFDPPRVGSDITFGWHEAHYHYDPPPVERCHRILGWSRSLTPALYDFPARYWQKLNYVGPQLPLPVHRVNRGTDVPWRRRLTRLLFSKRQ